MSNNSDSVFVTKCFLPPQKEYNLILERAWRENWITNRGELILELEQKIKEKFKISNITLTANGTLPIQIAIKALKLKGEIITTPFSYIATSSVIAWENCKPIYVDIDLETFNINHDLIEDKITSKTTAILVTHTFGNPCEIQEISKIAKKYNLKVIYDAAHCFGVTYKGKSIFEYGDVSTCSLHSTKIFHTGEGGAMFTTDRELHKILYYHHNFGHNGQEKYFGIGINAKMSELHAAMGLSILPYWDKIITKRKELYNLYKEGLSGVVSFQKIITSNYNYSYCPIVLDNEELLKLVIKKLNEENIYPRRYFYPSLNTIEYLGNQILPLAENLSKRVLCLPLFYDLKEVTVKKIIKVITSCH